jgi:hemerythrin superfamily protein
MSDAASNMPDIVESIRRDHAEARTLLDRYDTAGGRADWFCHVRETLVRHEVAEEVAVYPAIRHSGDPLKEVIDARLEEQRQAEKLLSAMEKMDVGGREYDKAFIELKAAVLEHAVSEESTILPAIESHKSVEQRRMMGERYERAKAAAPTHPHPHAPNTPPGNFVLGPVAALADRIRDAARNDDDQSDMSVDAQVGA